jgi:von Willebrand factor type A domain
MPYRTNFINYFSFRMISLGLLLCGMLGNFETNAQIKKTRILFLMDASSSMTYAWQAKQNRFEAAATVVSAIIDSMYAINNEVEFAVRVYGDQYGSIEKNCTDTRLIVPFNLQNLYQIKSKLKYIVPLGSSPIAYSLKEAAENELSNTKDYDYSFVLITDGGETCGGDICDMYKKIVANKVKVSPYIIGLDTNTLLKNYYECLGQYVNVTTPKDIAEAARLIVNNNRPLLIKPKTLNIPEPVVVKKIVVPEPIIITDELTKISSMINYFVYNIASKSPTISRAFRTNITLPPSLLVTTSPQLDVLSPIPMIALQKIAVSFSRVLIPLKLRAIKAKLPEEMIAEKTEEGVLMQKLDGITEIVPIKNNIASKKIASIATVFKPILPTEITEISFTPVEMNALELIKATIKIPSNTIAKFGKQTKINLYNLPKEITDIPYEPIEMNAIAKARARFSSITTLDAKIGFARKKTDYILPDILFIPPFVPELMEKVYAIPFRFSYQFASAPSIRLMMRLPKTSALPAELAVKKAPVKPAVPVGEKPDFKVETEPSSDTRIVVYFTDGLGKFYNAKPMVALVDPTTKKNIKTFMRDVLPGGEPEPVKLDIDGVFDVTVLGQRDIVLNNVTIEKNKINKIILKVSNGTLIFTYQNNRARPVNHTVKVWRRFVNKKTAPVEYSALEQRMFEPNEYYVELDILPKYGVHTEISFGAITEVQIPQEGAMQIITQSINGPVTLYYQNGDTYEEFMTVLMKGNVAEQKLYLRPGLYKASFVMPGMPKMAPPTIVSFQVKPNQETSFELKDYKGLTVTPDAVGKPIYINEKPKVDFINANPLLDGDGKEKYKKKK